MNWGGDSVLLTDSTRGERIRRFRIELGAQETLRRWTTLWSRQRRGVPAAIAWTTLIAGSILCNSIIARAVDLTSVTVVVNDAETGKPVSQAHLTLEFRQPG